MVLKGVLYYQRGRGWNKTLSLQYIYMERARHNFK